MRQIDYTRELNQEQLDVVLQGDGPCLVLAGAGSGKTRTIMYRVAHLIERGEDPSSILLLTFTIKAAREMRERVGALLGGDAGGVWAGTFHSIAHRILRRAASSAGYAPTFTILDQEDSRLLMKAVMKEAKYDVTSRRFPSPAVLQDIISFTRNTLRNIPDVLGERYPQHEPLSSEIEELARLYAERKRAAQAMDFDDLLHNWLLLLAHPEIGMALREKFQHILVDEYQDTNALQARIVRGLAEGHGNALVVGDDAQSIYAFRGADIQNILRFPKEWPDAKMFKLLTNYRSTPEILDVANDSLRQNVEQFQKELIGIAARGSKPVLVPLGTAHQEARFIADKILKLRSEGAALRGMAVLFRSSAHSHLLEMELVKRDIPYDYRGGVRFFGRAHIKDTLACLRIIQNVKDEPAWLRLLNLQQGIGPATASRLIAQARTAEALDDVMEDGFVAGVSERCREGWQSCLATLRAARAENGPAKMVRAIAGSAYAAYLEHEYPDWRDRLDDLEQLAMFAEGYQDADAFLGEVALFDDAVGRAAAGGAPTDEKMVLSTVHQAKGLEWDTVFIMHLMDGCFPSRYAEDDESQMEEERRLFYVAVTRARRRLYLTYSATRAGDGLSFMPPSLFVQELPPHLMERMEIREGFGGGMPARRESRWSGDGDSFYQEESIRVDRYGSTPRERTSTTTVFKSTMSVKKLPPR
ncbi:ATP-dependent helicase [Candidatus Uhrbacteria bacterium]|nr:ATP-dependent helicase [Candidatus Uhrbacteria bacterium]